jgi:hypothetical protein
VKDDELQLLEARWRLREITEDDLHGVANDLLDNGEESDALIRLFNRVQGHEQASAVRSPADVLEALATFAD